MKPIWNILPSATVTYSLPWTGMVLSFNGLSPNMEFILDRWFAEVRGEISPLLEAVEVNSTIRKCTRVDWQLLSCLVIPSIGKTFVTHSEETGLLDEIFG